jgi:hypothetical protein
MVYGGECLINCDGDKARERGEGRIFLVLVLRIRTITEKEGNRPEIDGEEASVDIISLQPSETPE